MSSHHRPRFVRLAMPLLVCACATLVVAVGCQSSGAATSPVPLNVVAVADAQDPESGDLHCRLYGAAGNNIEWGSIYNDLYAGSNSLSVQSQAGRVPDCNDGVGVAYYGTPFGTPQTYREPNRACEDRNYPIFANLLDVARPPVTLAHIRAATSGVINCPNPHPFHQTMGRHWSFAHNGSVNRVRVRGLIRPAFLAAYPPNCSYVYDCNDPNSVTDSEYYFIYLLQCIYDNRFNVPAGVAAAMAELRSESGALNFLLSDGMNEWAFRRDDVYGHHTLYWYSRCGDGHASSERPDTTNPYWSFMEDYQLVNLHTGVSIPDVLHLQMLADVAFEDSLDSADLRADTPGVQDWYESRNEQPTILFLDLTDVAGNDTAKAGLANAGIKKSAALTQELDKPYNSLRFECDVFISKIEATGSTNRTAHLYLGNDQDGKYPLGAAKERFVWLAFYDPQPGGAGSDLQLRARTSPSQPENDTSTWVLLASKLDHAIWHELRVRIDGAKGLYDVQLDGELVAEDVPKYAEYTDSSVSYVGFAAETYARGNFFVDRALASIDDLSLTGLVTLPGGAPAQQATITARLLYCGTTYTTQTDNTGHYLLEGLPPDTYRVSARKTIGNVTYGRDICSVPYEDGTVDLDISIVPNWPLCQDQ